MKKLILIGVILVISISLIGVIPVAGADENHSLVFKSALIDAPPFQGPGSNIVVTGEVMVWNDASMKIMLITDGVPGGLPYNVAIQYGPPNARQIALVGTITTGENGQAIGFFDLNQLLFPSPPPFNQITTPGFVVSTPMGPVATTGFTISNPTP